MDSKRNILKKNTIMGCGGDILKKSQSELALEELFHQQKLNHNHIYGVSDHLHFPSTYSDVLSDFPSNTSFASSISVNTVRWDNYDQAVGGSSDQSDEDDLEMEAGSSQQTTNRLDNKKIKRMVSNRESARRSRRRKQAYQTNLEQQVEQLRGENASLFKQFSHASHQFKDAATNHRVLKSEVEALRAKVKLAEDLVARGSLTSSLSHLIENYLSTPEDYMNNNNVINRMDNVVSPLVSCRGDDNSPYSCVTDSGIGLENVETFDSNNVSNGVMVTHVPEMWTSWESHVSK